jgi:uncharacterized protein (DUF924 family)
MPVAPSHALPPQAAAVLAFWFGPAAGEPAPVLRPGWFRRDAAFDAAIATQFLPELESAQAGGLTDWDTAGPLGVLAHIVVLDQFSRNVFRGSPRGFAGDGLALALAKQLVASGADRDLLPEQRLFAYLPFEHSEDLSDQAESLRLFGALAAERAGPARAAGLRGGAPQGHCPIRPFSAPQRHVGSCVYSRRAGVFESAGCWVLSDPTGR